MSTRNMRKLFGTTTLPPPDENSDDDFVPLYTKKKSAKGTYSALEVMSATESEPECDSPVKDDLEAESSQQERKKKKNNRKKRKAQKTKPFDVDDIDKSLREVNAILGEPPVKVEEKEKKVDPEAVLFTVQQKHLDANYEMRRVFGPESEEVDRRRQRQHNVKHQRNIVMPNEYIFNKLGLSMSIKRREGDITYFTFDHNREYRMMYQYFLHSFERLRALGVMAPLEDLSKNMLIEALLESADICFRMDDHSSANEILEQCIAYMQYVAHPTFTLTGRRCRLEYKYLENRTFHVALLKYLYLLTNRACHRTALEIAKALLNLDPSDPLAVIFIIDTLALRAREHKWLYDTIEYWNTTREAGYMFNLQYSYALCCFHLTNSKNKEVDMDQANKVLKNCLLKFPFVLIKILECCNQNIATQLKTSQFFNAIATENTPKPLQDLMCLYAKLTWSRWRESAVLEWLVRGATQVTQQFDSEPEEQSKILKEVRKQFGFASWPAEIIRHLCVIKPMAGLIVDGAVPSVPTFMSSNPRPPADNVNRYNYEPTRDNRHFVMQFLGSLRPFTDN